MRILYFYGFISSPLSTKAQYFQNQFESLKIDFEIVDIVPNAESFTNMRPSRLPDAINKHIVDHNYKNAILMGSSFGGLLAAWYAVTYPQKVDKLILMAPALELSANGIARILETRPAVWKQQNNISISHPRFGLVPLSYTFYEDLSNNPPPDFSSKTVSIPTLIFHAEKDDVVPISWSKNYAINQPNISLHILVSDHKLLDQQEVMWKHIKKFLGYN